MNFRRLSKAGRGSSIESGDGDAGSPGQPAAISLLPPSSSSPSLSGLSSAASQASLIRAGLEQRAGSSSDSSPPSSSSSSSLSVSLASTSAPLLPPGSSSTLSRSTSLKLTPDRKGSQPMVPARKGSQLDAVATVRKGRPKSWGSKAGREIESQLRRELAAYEPVDIGHYTHTRPCSFAEKDSDAAATVEGTLGVSAERLGFVGDGLSESFAWSSILFFAASIASEDESATSSIEFVAERVVEAPTDKSGKKKNAPSSQTTVYFRCVLTPVQTHQGMQTLLFERWTVQPGSFVANVTTPGCVSVTAASSESMIALALRGSAADSSPSPSSSSSADLAPAMFFAPLPAPLAKPTTPRAEPATTSSSAAAVEQPAIDIADLPLSELTLRWFDALQEQFATANSAIVFPSPSVECPLEVFSCLMSTSPSQGPTQLGCLYVFQQYVCFVPKLSKKKTVIPFYPNTVSVDKIAPSFGVNSVRLVASGMGASGTASITYVFSSFFFTMCNHAFELMTAQWKNQLKNAATAGSGASGAAPAASGGDQDFYRTDEKGRSFLDSLSHLTADGSVNLTDMFGFQLTPAEHGKYLEFMPRYLQNVEAQKRLWAKFKSKYRLDVEWKTNSKRVKKLVRGGVPYELRGEVWWVLSGAAERAEQARTSGERSYAQLTTIRTPHLRDIEKDIHRTFPDHPFFRNRDNRDKLRRILVAFANYCPLIGYCQSINFIAGMLLLFLSEERTFWVLTCVISGDQTHYYTQSMKGLQLDHKVLDHLASRKMPALFAHLQGVGVTLTLLTTQWFMCMTLTSFPTETALRILDNYFVEGPCLFHLVVLAFLKLHTAELGALRDFSDIAAFFKEKAKCFFDFQLLLTTAFEAFGVFDAPALKQLRDKFRREIDDSVLVRTFDELRMKTDMEMSVIQYIYAVYIESLRTSPGLSLQNFLDVGRLHAADSSEEAVENVFHLFDNDHDGYIDNIAATKAIWILGKDNALRAKYKSDQSSDSDQQQQQQPLPPPPPPLSLLADQSSSSSSPSPRPRSPLGGSAPATPIVQPPPLPPLSGSAPSLPPPPPVSIASPLPPVRPARPPSVMKRSGGIETQ